MNEPVEPLAETNSDRFTRELAEALRVFRATARAEEIADAEDFMNALAARFRDEARASNESSRSLSP